MQKLTNLSKEELIELIVREREALSAWQPIESAPLDRVVLFCDNSLMNEPFFYTGIRKHGRRCLDITETVGFMATHWQPLPTPPMEV